MREATLFNAATNSGTQTSPGFQLGDLTAYSVGTTFSDAAAAGTIKLQGANEDVTTSYVDISGLSTVVAAGAPALHSTTVAGYRWVRAVWTSTGGAGTLTSKLIAKELVVKGA